jgi:hypothetical protein
VPIVHGADRPSDDEAREQIEQGGQTPPADSVYKVTQILAWPGGQTCEVAAQGESRSVRRWWAWCRLAHPQAALS